MLSAPEIQRSTDGTQWLVVAGTHILGAFATHDAALRYLLFADRSGMIGGGRTGVNDSHHRSHSEDTMRNLYTERETSPGKYEGEPLLTRALDAAEGWAEEEIGTTEDIGFHAFFNLENLTEEDKRKLGGDVPSEIVAAILVTDSFGHTSGTYYDSIDAATKEWGRIAKMAEEWHEEDDSEEEAEEPLKVETWEERDRLHIALMRGDTYLAEWWDDDARQMFTDGYFKSGSKLEDSVIEYARECGLI